MRKFFITIMSIMLVGVLCLSSLFGCKLITTNDDRNMNQVVATVKIDDAPMKTIYKKDVIDHVSVNYGTLTNELFEQGLDDLIQKGVLVQYAMQHFADEQGVSGANKWELENYLDADEIVDCKYQAYSRFDELIDYYLKEKPADKLGDTYSGTVRVVPASKKTDSELEAEVDAGAEISNEKKKQYIDNSNFFEKIENNTDKYNAYIKTINVLKANGLLGDYVYGQIETIEYVKQYIVVYEENLLLEKFQDDIEKDARSIVKYENVQAEYERLYKIQSEASASSFESTLANASAQNPILSGQKGYGLVYHILLKADEEMTKKLEDKKEEYQKNNGTPAYQNSIYREDRAEIFNNIKAQDQRKSWIESKYDFGKVITNPLNGYDMAFEGDYTFFSDENSLPFFGKVTHLNPLDKDNEDYKARYRVDDVKKFSLTEILELINEYLYDGSAKFVEEDGSLSAELKVQDRAEYTATKLNEDYDKRVKELMFAFSQDDSDTALNTYKGYAIKPQVDGTKQEEWQLEFAEVGRQLITHDENTFMLVATDYGYHIMFFSEKYDGYSYPNLESYLNKEYNKNEGKTQEESETYWKQEFNYMVTNYKDYKDTDNYMYVLYSNLISTYVDDAFNNEKQEIFGQYVNNSQVVVKYQDAYKEYIQE